MKTMINSKSIKLIALIGILILPIISLVFIVLKYAVNMPISDDYGSILGWLDNYIANPNYQTRLHMLFDQHGEHRIVFNRITELIQLHCFGKVNFIYLSLFGMLGLIINLCLIIKLSISKGLKAIHLIPLPYLLLSLSQWELIDWAMASTQQYWQLFFSVTAITLITSAKNYFTYFIGLIFVILAIFTGGGGLMIFPVILFYYILTRAKFHKMAIWIGFISIILYIYFIALNYAKTTDNGMSLSFISQNLKLIIMYLFCFLGGMIYGNYDVLTILALMSGLILFLVFLFLTIRRIYLKQPELYCIMLFIISIAGVASITRFHEGIMSAFGSRYTIYTGLFLVSIYITILLEFKNQQNIITKYGSVIAILIYLLWLPNGITCLNTRYNNLNQKLMTTTINQDYKILNQAVNNKIFFPLPNIAQNLPYNLPLNNGQLYKSGYDGSIDYLNYTNGRLLGIGWGIIKYSPDLPVTAILKIDRNYYPLNYGEIIRPDVVKNKNNQAYLKCGYKFTLNIHDLLNRCLSCSQPFGAEYYNPNNTNNNQSVYVRELSIILVDQNRHIFYPSPCIKINLSDLNHIKFLK